MAYCVNCGSELVDNAKFCQKCGQPTGNAGDSTRSQEYVGKIYKCPNCGEVLKAFEINCPACGHELRGAKASSAVREFALKLEAIEAKREYEKNNGLSNIFAATSAQLRVSKTDEQKISLIKSFVVPNSKEDMLEFMILATSSMNMDAYDALKTNVTKSDKEINAAWFSKVQQVYEKAKRSYSADNVFVEIKALYDECNKKINRTKKKGVIKYVLLVGWMPILFIALFLWAAVYAPFDEKKEVARLEAIVEEIEEQLEKGQFKYALMNAEGLVYDGSIRNEEQTRKWVIEREYWIDKIIEDAAESGIILERPIDEEEQVSTQEDNASGGFVDGFKEGLQPGLDSMKEAVDEFNQTMDEIQENYGGETEE